MSGEAALRDLLDRWLRVWHHGEYDLVPSCVAPQYVRHDAVGDRIVTPESYAAEIAATRTAMPEGSCACTWFPRSSPSMLSPAAAASPPFRS